jgi:hypothetical protein
MMDGRYNQPPRARYYYDDRYAYHSEDEEDFAAFNYQNERRRPSQRPIEEQGDGILEEKDKGKQKESMSSWLGRVSTSSQAQFAATAIVSGAVVAGAILGYQSIRRQERVKDLKSEIPEAADGWGGDKVGFTILAASEV